MLDGQQAGGKEREAGNEEVVMEQKAVAAAAIEAVPSSDAAAAAAWSAASVKMRPGYYSLFLGSVDLVLPLSDSLVCSLESDSPFERLSLDLWRLRLNLPDDVPRHMPG